METNTENKLQLNTPLKASEIKFRVQSINKGGFATILAYKDARVDMDRLNAVYGVGYWQRKHTLINNRLFCSIGIWNDKIKQWVWIEDVGTESMAEKEKGQASDSFKRACFNLGIGKELYDYPLIQVKLNSDEFVVEGNRVKQSYNFNLRDWKWLSQFSEDGKITFLACKDTKGQVRWSFGKFDKDLHQYESMSKNNIENEAEMDNVDHVQDAKNQLNKVQIKKTLQHIESAQNLTTLQAVFETVSNSDNEQLQAAYLEKESLIVTDIIQKSTKLSALEKLETMVDISNYQELFDAKKTELIHA